MFPFDRRIFKESSSFEKRNCAPRLYVGARMISTIKYAPRPDCTSGRTRYQFYSSIWYRRADLNRYGFLHRILNPARLPISPRRHFTKVYQSRRKFSSDLHAFGDGFSRKLRLGNGKGAATVFSPEEEGERPGSHVRYRAEVVILDDDLLCAAFTQHIAK